MTGKMIPFGYANGGMTGLERLMVDPSAYLVDIRLVALMDPKPFKQPIASSGSLKLFDVKREVIAHAEVMS